MTVSIIIGFLGFIAIFLFSYQRRMIYFPRSYKNIDEKSLTQNATAISFETDSGKQICFYVPPQKRPEDRPLKLWIFFGGNASLALDWLEFIEDIPDHDKCGFLLIDYPGYGFCKGKPTREGIMQNMDGAMKALGKKMDMKMESLEEDLNVLGHSLGSAAAMEFAVRHPVKRVVLLSPFTSLLDMARLQVRWPLCNLLRDRFDNMALLDEIAKTDKSSRPEFHIFHGKADQIVPFSMGKKLAESHPDMIKFHPLPDVTHDIIFYAGKNGLYEIINEKESAGEE